MGKIKKYYKVAMIYFLILEYAKEDSVSPENDILQSTAPGLMGLGKSHL